MLDFDVMLYYAVELIENDIGVFADQLVKEVEDYRSQASLMRRCLVRRLRTRSMSDTAPYSSAVHFVSKELSFDLTRAESMREAYLALLELALRDEEAAYFSLLAGMGTDGMITGAVTPESVISTMSCLTFNSFPAVTEVLGIGLLADFQTRGFVDTIDCTTYEKAVQLGADRHALLTTGKLGYMFGMEMFTDGFRNPRLHSVDPNRLFIMTSPDTHGFYDANGLRIVARRDGNVITLEVLDRTAMRVRAGTFSKAKRTP